MSEIINNEKLVGLRQQYELKERQAKRMAVQQKIDAKDPVLKAYQNGQITAEEYQELMGETYGETIKEWFGHQMFLARSAIAVRVPKYISPEEFETITGVPYNEEDYR